MAVKINKMKLLEDGLACPFEKSDPARYKDQVLCRPGRGWSKVGDINEHIWRFHSPLYRCEYCGCRFSAVDNRDKVKANREKHILHCKEEHKGVLRQPKPNDVEILSKEQQAEFEKVSRIKDVDKKFVALYKACGKAQPETYHVKPLAPSRRSTTSSMWDGLNPPDAVLQPASPQVPISSAQLRRNHQRAQANDPEPVIPSGTNKTLDRDSGYASREHEGTLHEPEPPMSPCSQILGYARNFGSQFYDGSGPDAPPEAHPDILKEFDDMESVYPPL